MAARPSQAARRPLAGAQGLSGQGFARLVAWYEVLEPIGSVGFIVALVPQFYRTLKLGHANDVDVWFLLIVLASSLVLLLWAIVTTTFYLAVSFGANLVVWGTVLWYRLRPRHEAPQ